MSTPRVSIVIPAYNAQPTITHAIQALCSQACPDSIEIIIVDDGSSDSTPQIVQSFREVKYIRQDNAGPAAARNKGAAASKGAFILFTDSDCIPRKNWVEKMIKCFVEDTIGVVSGSYGIANPQNLLARCIHQEILFRHQSLMPRYPRAFGSYNFAVRRHVFFEAGGFDESYRRASGEDNDLSYKILKKGYRIYFAKDALVDHYHTTRIKKYLEEQFRHGFWRAKTYWDHPGMARGDDYTFWKDALEVPVVFLFCGTLGASLFEPWLLKFFILIIAIPFLILEVYFGFKMSHTILESLYFGFVMFLRSFARGFGLSMGILAFSYRKIVEN